ncbi:protein lin-52 homolog [Scaptodrosophila lebanonensis]|uniref:Protein lin-52 homolog n=1 Tax=Drosophila lebanonensis TaxID=7225 RepID=A0A6J2TT83_DROLE|nr:protein lin-52 homolog [Scaptodrosophila lebanonensis]
MSKIEPNLEIFAPETILKTDEDADTTQPQELPSPNSTKPEPEDHLKSFETLRESPIQWPERFPGMDEFLNMSDTPIHTPNRDCTHTLTTEDMARINQLAALTPDQLIAKIRSMHDEIYQLGLREAKEMTRGKLLGIFDRFPKNRKPKDSS